MPNGEITYTLDELHLYLDGRESTLYVYGSADIAFDGDDLLVRRITLKMEKGELELAPRDPLFPLIERTLTDHHAECVWEEIKTQYAEEAYWSRVDEGRAEAKDARAWA